MRKPGLGLSATPSCLLGRAYWQDVERKSPESNIFRLPLSSITLFRIFLLPQSTISQQAAFVARTCKQPRCYLDKLPYPLPTRSYVVVSTGDRHPSQWTPDNPRFHVPHPESRILKKTSPKTSLPSHIQHLAKLWRILSEHLQVFHPCCRPLHFPIPSLSTDALR